MKNMRILGITLLAAFALAGTSTILSRYGHHGGYWGGRGWGGYGWGGYSWDGPYWGGYYPYAGLGWGWPGYYSRPSFAKDNAGQTYWIVYNNSNYPVRIKSDRDETTLQPGAAKKLYRKRSYVIRVYYKNEMRPLKTREHEVGIKINEVGVPQFDLDLISNEKEKE